jgi:large subunit ribosomal protein L28
LQTVHITDQNGTNRSVRVCTQCIRSGAITKTVRSAPFRLPKEAAKAKAAAGAPAATKGKSKDSGQAKAKVKA